MTHDMSTFTTVSQNHKEHFDESVRKMYDDGYVMLYPPSRHFIDRYNQNFTAHFAKPIKETAHALC